MTPYDPPRRRTRGPTRRSRTNIKRAIFNRLLAQALEAEASDVKVDAPVTLRWHRVRKRSGEEFFYYVATTHGKIVGTGRPDAAHPFDPSSASVSSPDQSLQSRGVADALCVLSPRSADDQSSL